MIPLTLFSSFPLFDPFALFGHRVERPVSLATENPGHQDSELRGLTLGDGKSWAPGF